MDAFAVVVFVVLVVMGWIRFSPVDRDTWHVDPADDDIHRAKVKLIGQNAPRFPGEPAEVLENVAKIALSDSGVKILDGSIEEGMITFVTRKGILGKRDFITLKAAIDVDGTKLSALGRPRYYVLGSDSLRRIENWLSALNRHYRG